MNKAIKRIDVSNFPDLMRLDEEVQASQEPRMLTRDHEKLAVLMPVEKSTRRSRKPRAKTEADHAAFRAATGSWKGWWMWIS
jgi:hypothetical protein